MVHWLNNKDLSFTTSMDLFMQQLRKLSEHPLEHGASEDMEQDTPQAKFDFGTAHPHHSAVCRGLFTT